MKLSNKHVSKKKGNFYFFFFCIFLLIQFRPSLTPSPLTAEHACMCQPRSRIVCKFKPSAISLALAEFIRSCLLANINTGTPKSFSSANNSESSYFFCFKWDILKTLAQKLKSIKNRVVFTSPVSSNLLRSALSIT